MPVDRVVFCTYPAQAEIVVGKACARMGLPAKAPVRTYVRVSTVTSTQILNDEHMHTYVRTTTTCAQNYVRPTLAHIVVMMTNNNNKNHRVRRDTSFGYQDELLFINFK